MCLIYFHYCMCYWCQFGSRRYIIRTLSFHCTLYLCTSLKFPMLSERDFGKDAKEGTINAWGRFYGGNCSKDDDCASGIAYCELKLNPQVNLPYYNYYMCFMSAVMCVHFITQECRPAWWFWLLFSIALALLALCLVCCILNGLSDCISNCCRRRR